MYTQTTDEKRNTLWSLLQEQSNKKCMDCTAQNPSFACAALGTFVCVRCAELLREFGVQVKSVVSASFSEEEIKYLLQQGNAVARHKWLARWTPNEFPEPSHDEPIRVRQFMVLKYKERKWASGTTNLVNPIYDTPKLVDVSTAPFIPIKQSNTTSQALFPVDFVSPEYGSPQPIRKDPPGYPGDPFPNGQQFTTPPAVRPTASSNPFDPPQAFTPIMSPPTHPQSPPPSEAIAHNPFLQNFIAAPTTGPSSPSQMYLSPPVTSNHQNAQHTQSQLGLNPTTPPLLSPALPNGTSQPLPNHINISPMSSPVVGAAQGQQQQQQQQQPQQQLLQQPPAPVQSQPPAQSPPPPAAVQSTPNSAPALSHAPPLSRASSMDDTSRMLEEVRALKSLYEMQMMGKEEYEARRIQLIDSLTKTTHENKPNATPAALEPRLAGTERAIRHRFDVKKGKWCHTATIVLVEPNPFAEGAMRKAFRMRDLSQEGQLSLMVAKVFRDPSEDRASYFKDVEMQMQAKEIADRYNRRNPPKKVDFVSAFVYELVDRPNKQICSAEYFIDGKFEKHNNNFGYINDDTERNTPQVFSHFSYEDSNGQLIVVDIQGVDDIYTDPQIHTLDGQGYGRGNLGAEGINKFFSTHACNQICHFYGLTAVNPKQPLTDAGTKPQPKLNQSTNVDRFNFGGDVFDVLRAQHQSYTSSRN